MIQHDYGLISIRSRYSVPETLNRLEEVLREQGQTVFCRIDHDGEAAKVGLKMQPAKVLIFGNPKGGTALMVAAPTVAIDLPLKALAWQDADGQVWLSYNDPEYLQQRHAIPSELVQNIAGVRMLIEAAAQGTEGKAA